MMTLDEIRIALTDRNLTEVGKRLGMSKQYLYRIRKGEIKNPGYENLRKLMEYLGGK